MKRKANANKNVSDAEKRSALSLKRILQNNMFILHLLLQSAPGMVLLKIALYVSDSITQVLTLYFIRYAVSIAENNGIFSDILLPLFLLFLLLATVNILGNILNELLQPKFSEQISRRFKGMFLEKAKNCDLSCYEDPDFYEKYTRAMQEGNDRYDRVIRSISGFISALITLFGLGNLLLQADPFLLILVSLPAVTGMMTKKLNVVKLEMREQLLSVGRRKGYPLRVFYQNSYAKEVRSTNISVPLMTRLKDATDEAIGIYHKYGGRKVALYALQMLIDGIATNLLPYLYIAYQTVVTQHMELGGGVIAVMASKNVTGAISDIVYTGMSFHEHAIFIENLRTFLEYRPKICETDNQIPPQNGDIVLNHVSFRYRGATADSLQDISMTIHQGEKIALVGYNGAGKTTLTKLLLRLYDPTEGSISLAGKDIRTLKLSAYRDLYSTVLQDFRHFSFSVKDNVLLRQSQDGDDALVYDALQKSDAYDFVMAHPDGIHAMMDREFDDNGIVPSGGQGQKLALAHVYLKSSPIVILDEPSSALDPLAEYEMYNHMMEVCRGKTLIFISHRMSSAVLADRIFLMENGKIAESGSHRELMQQNGLYASLFRRQAESYLPEGGDTE